MTNASDTSRPVDEPSGGRPETPAAQPLGGRDDGGTIAERVGRDPSNLGDDVPQGGDIQHPTPDPGDAQI
ncbi:hypothetical protein BH24CHL6_BH24CHL6_16110 [soil metagenome]